MDAREIHQMLITLVSILPQEELVRSLEKGLDEYHREIEKVYSKEDKFKVFEGALAFPAFMILIKSHGDPLELIKKIDTISRVQNLITPNDN